MQNVRGVFPLNTQKRGCWKVSFLNALVSLFLCRGVRVVHLFLFFLHRIFCMLHKLNPSYVCSKVSNAIERFLLLFFLVAVVCVSS